MSEIETKLLALAKDDNVYVALCTIGVGRVVASDGVEISVGSAVTLGHKIARREIAPGDKILKYGVPIGSAIAAIAAGEHVHVHNMKSDYTATHLLQETAQGAPNA